MGYVVHYNENKYYTDVNGDKAILPVGFKVSSKIDEQTMNKIKKMVKISNLLRKIGIDLRKVIFKKFHNAFGGRMKYFFCAGSYLKLDVKDFYDDLGIKIQCAYGLTECSS